jgi:hypothetical protein
MADTYTFAAEDGIQFSVDQETRVISGLIVPFGVNPIDGRAVSFKKGDIGWSSYKAVKLNLDHDSKTSFGYGLTLAEGEKGIEGSFKVADGPRGDEALALAASGVYDGLSVNLYKPEGKEKFHLTHVALTAEPAFDQARVNRIAASAASNKEGAHVMGDNTETAEAPQDFSAVTNAISEGFASLNLPPREVVPAGNVQVKEELPYRFDGGKAAHSFSQDIRDAYMSHDAEAMTRLNGFLDDAWEAFAVTTTNTGSLNPTKNRPELYVPNLQYSRPLWDLVTNGTVDDVTPFTVPKFSSASGLVGAHTQGTEPTPGSFAATSQTITPTPLSGKIEINREVWDQGGSPQADQIIWAEMLGGYFEAIEARIATTLAAVSTTEVNLAGAVDESLVDAVQNMLVNLQFVRGGNRFTALALDGMLFPALVNASDTTGRKLLPVLGATNAQGQVSAGFDGVQIGNLTGRAAWALGSTNASKSYLFVPSSVYAWASAPKKFVFEYQVKSIDMAIWGYAATAVTRDSDVKPLDYTDADA